jgi:hypothetical protein
MIRATRFGAALAVLAGQVARVVRCSSSCTAYASGYGKSSTGCEALAASGHGARPVASVTLPPWHGSHNPPSSREQSARARSDGSRPRAAQPRKRASRQGHKSWRLARDTPTPRRYRGVPYTPLSDAANVVTAARRRGWLRRRSCGRVATAPAGSTRPQSLCGRRRGPRTYFVSSTEVAPPGKPV